jgi:acyl carrier protein
LQCLEVSKHDKGEQMKSPIFKSELKVFLGLMFVAALVSLAFINYAQSEQSETLTHANSAQLQNQAELNAELATKQLLAQHLDISLAKVQSEATLKQLGVSESLAAEIILALEDRYEISLFESKGFDLNVTVASLVNEVEEARHSETAGM